MGFGKRLSLKTAKEFEVNPGPIYNHEKNSISYKSTIDSKKSKEIKNYNTFGCNYKE